MSKLLKNTTGANVLVSDTGVTVLASSTYTVPTRDYLLWAASSSITSLVNAGTIVVNDGNRDLSAAQGLRFLKYPDDAFNIYFASPPDRSNVLTTRTVQEAIEEVNTKTLVDASDTTLGYLADKIIGTANRLIATIINVGGNEQLKLDISASEGTPLGTIIDFAGASAPTKYLRCDGSAVNRTTYADLFAAIGTTWGVGNGTTTFNLPLADGVGLWGADGTHAVGLSTGSDTVNLAHTHGTGTLVNDTAPAHTHDITHTHQIDPPITTTSAAPSQVVGILSLLSSAAPAGHTHTVDIPAFTSGAPSTTNSGSGGSHTHVISGSTDSQLSSSQDIRPKRVYTLKCIRATL